MPREPFHRLFFAVRPPPGTIPEIAALRDEFGQTHNLVNDARLHLTTWLFSDRQDYPADAAARATRAMRDVPGEPFGVVLDRIVAGPGHVLLLPGDPLPGFAAFQTALDRALRHAGLAPRVGWRFDPHLTLLHGRHIADRAIDPIGWTVREIVLIDSVVGERRHETIARFPLGPHRSGTA